MGSSNSFFYSTFIAAENTPYQASAICLFSLSQINKVFFYTVMAKSIDPLCVKLK